MRVIISLGINLLIVMTFLSLNCDSAAAPIDPTRESLEILKHLQLTMRSMDIRLNNLESKLSTIDLIQGKIDDIGSSILIIGGKVERIESILNKLQLTDQERKKWCNSDYGSSLFSLHKTESESIRSQMSSMLQEISELIRTGMGKLLTRMDSLLTETSKHHQSHQPSNENYDSTSISVGGNWHRPATSSSSTLPSTTTTHSRAGYELSTGDETINKGNIVNGGCDNKVTVTLERFNNKLDTLMGRCLPDRNGDNTINRGAHDNNNNQLLSSLAQFRSLSQDTLNTMVKKIELTENQLLTSVLSSLEIPARLLQVKERVEDNVNKLRTQVDGLSSNAPILRILRHIQTQLPDVSRVTCMDEQTSELLEKVTSQVNTMIIDYAKQIEAIDRSLTNANSFVTRLSNMVDKSKNSFVQSPNNNTTSGHLRTSSNNSPI